MFIRFLFSLIFLSFINFPTLFAASSSLENPHVVVLDDLKGKTIDVYRPALQGFSQEERTIITCKENMTPETEAALCSCFDNILYVDTNANYYFSAAVEQLLNSLNAKKKITIILTSPVEEIDIMRAAHFREIYQIRGQKFKSAEAFRDKVVMKSIVEKAGIWVPKFQATKSGFDLIEFAQQQGYPLVLKPRTGVGAIQTDVIKNEEELGEFLKTNYNGCYSSNYMVESFIKGQVYQIDGLFDPATKKTVAWPSVYINNCLEMALERKILGSHLLSPTNPLTNKLRNYAELALGSLPVDDKTTFHLEVFVTDEENIIFCEIASRVGGYVNTNWKRAIGIDLEDYFCHFQCGQDHDFSKLTLTPPSNIVGWLLFPMEQSKKIEKIPSYCPLEYCFKYEVYKKPGDYIEKTAGIIHNLALVYLSASTEDMFEQRAQEVIRWFNSELTYED